MKEIPKIIHYCWFGPNEMPQLVLKCIGTWRKNMPEYEYRLWNEANSPMEQPFVKRAYKNKKYAFVSDYVRLWALYEYGGIYLDTDMFVLKHFDDLLNYELFLGYQDKDCEYINASILGASSLNNDIRSIIHRYNEMQDMEDYLEIAIPKIITEYFLKTENASNIKIFSYDYFYPLPFEKRKEKNVLSYCTENSYAIHLWNYSWMSNGDKVKRRLKLLVKMLSKGEFSFKRLIKGS